MAESINIDSVFDEKECICGHSSVEKFTNLTDTFVKYRGKLISLVQIVRDTLNFEPTPENCSMEICEQCKVKLQDFYNFKMKALAARTALHSQQSDERLNVTTDSVECSILEIIRNYIKTFSIQSIEIKEESKSMLVIAGKAEDACIEEFIEDDFGECDTEIDSLNEPSEIEQEEVIVMEEQSEIQTPNLGSMKRSKNPEEWACNKRKKLRNSGQSYINSKGKVVSERKMREPCNSCRSRCQTKISEQDRLANFDSFWKLGDVVQQRMFIYNHILSKEPSRRKSAQSTRSKTLQFYLDTHKNEGNVKCVQVCKKMFKNTLAISNQVIQGVVSKYSTTGFVDPRGRHERKLSEAQKLAQSHVEKFPFFYIEGNMTKIQLYNLYIEECRQADIEPVKESNYREIFERFHTNSFLKTDKIACEKCNEYNKATVEERNSLQKDYNEHLEVDKKCRDRALARVRHRRSMERRKKDNSGTLQ